MLVQWSVAGPILGLGVAAVVLGRSWAAQPFTHIGSNHAQQRAFAQSPVLSGKYKIRQLLSSGHVETIFAALFRKPALVLYDRSTLTGPDGGITALDAPATQVLSEDAPVLVLLPGLASNSKDTYVQHLAATSAKAGFRTVVLNGRGCGSRLSTPQTFSASFTGDVRQLMRELKEQYPQAPLYGVGWSLGANILLRYLGEEGSEAPLAGAVSLCNPFDLVESDKQIRTGFNRIYERALATGLRRIYIKNAAVFKDSGRPFKHKQAAAATTIRAWDDAIQTVSYGWKDVDAYYAGSGSAGSVPAIRVPTLCIQAHTDPIAPARCIPRKAIQENPFFSLVITPAGGHLGWVSGPTAPVGAPWTDAAVVQWLQGMQQTLKHE